MLDNLSNLKQAEEIREVLRSFYTVLKSYNKYLRFVLITGIIRNNCYW
ncbi:MAG: AAA family ATPase [Synergistaceae bacterium]|nr:AAA family ATPase [Synergistaceae bacterium]MBQ3585654.1 AAA family ATPase [Synergistaceae bacterium]MBQ6001835.1 AAA family ATPase [Synergistaceae bacterium]